MDIVLWNFLFNMMFNFIKYWYICWVIKIIFVKMENYFVVEEYSRSSIFFFCGRNFDRSKLNLYKLICIYLIL